MNFVYSENYDRYKLILQMNILDDIKFEISGGDLGLILNTVRSILSTKEAQQILMADRANSVLENIIAEHVEKGLLQEISENNEKD